MFGRDLLSSCVKSQPMLSSRFAIEEKLRIPDFIELIVCELKMIPFF